MLSDHSETHPHLIFKRLKQQGGVFNYQKQTIAGLLAGRDQTLRERRRMGQDADGPHRHSPTSPGRR